MVFCEPKRLSEPQPPGGHEPRLFDSWCGGVPQVAGQMCDATMTKPPSALLA